ncbi:heavy-metal-associated domain-containing protein [Pseudomonas sp. ZM23]|uniref:Heavy-metal-associated domain-containing protein n=1 Tax=Pseudomonas triclosanedens TaxID=2961893 RepID=A0ABY6ZQC7_9PSED|nr:heavy-metal-associated domain-containing protein [Pseudomonas triclosanedens]MCP8467643.1 heavy-metal-associated domain-containing protein [Pseudomonas triclosanedens]MCP8473389.1 heavy-metal-associated domain-containing protein [Pseudomonas triclosanedens]MCP8479418.1 heavy-metal-associated domain-containing protein [Pseudomonas triclosanedens]WAI47112.1 heavy-metal-associated domain-containing protein [Pseudomonas triclosanedens]
MISIEVKDMTCGHCESTLRKAIAAVDAGATVKVDLPARRLDIESSAAASDLLEAVRSAGYTPGSVLSAAAKAPAQGQRGCCCG